MDIDEVSFCVIPGCRTINKVFSKKRRLYTLNLPLIECLGMLHGGL